MSFPDQISPQRIRTPIPNQQPNYTPFKECSKISSDSFDSIFNGDKYSLSTGYHANTVIKPITSVDIGDCITIFGIETNSSEQVTEISACHLGSYGEGDIQEYFDIFDTSSSETKLSFFLIGGTTDTIQGNTCLLQTIYADFNEKFGSLNSIKGRLLDVRGNYKHVTAGLNMEGELFYYRHD